MTSVLFTFVIASFIVSGNCDRLSLEMASANSVSLFTDFGQGDVACHEVGPTLRQTWTHEELLLSSHTGTTPLQVAGNVGITAPGVSIMVTFLSFAFRLLTCAVVVDGALRCWPRQDKPQPIELCPALVEDTMEIDARGERLSAELTQAHEADVYVPLWEWAPKVWEWCLPDPDEAT